MSADPNKKSSRTFQCRDVLWETFEQMARELECSVHYLINEAMKQYARQRNYGTRTPFPGAVQRSGAETGGSSSSGGGQPPPVPNRPPTAPLPSAAPRTAPAQASAPAQTGVAVAQSPGAHGVAPPAARPAGAPQGPSHRPLSSATTRSAAARTVPPPLPRTAIPQPVTAAPDTPAPHPHPTPAGILSLVYQGEKLPITKDRFVIGRGKQSSDLTLRDPNVSRQHAMIEFQHGAYFMVDMGSTNGVEFERQRVARKQIAEGDVFRICDHEIVFTFR